MYSRLTINIATGRPLEQPPRGSSRPERSKMQEYKDWDANLAPDPAPTVHNVHIGDIIKIKINDEDHIGRTSKYGQYEVVGIYPRIVLTRDKKTGFRRSFSYGDLLTMGLENQGPEIDELRKYNKKDQSQSLG